MDDKCISKCQNPSEGVFHETQVQELQTGRRSDGHLSIPVNPPLLRMLKTTYRQRKDPRTRSEKRHPGLQAAVYGVAWTAKMGSAESPDRKVCLAGRSSSRACAGSHPCPFRDAIRGCRCRDSKEAEDSLCSDFTRKRCQYLSPLQQRRFRAFETAVKQAQQYWLSAKRCKENERNDRVWKLGASSWSPPEAGFRSPGGSTLN